MNSFWKQEAKQQGYKREKELENLLNYDTAVHKRKIINQNIVNRGHQKNTETGRLQIFYQNSTRGYAVRVCYAGY